MKVLKICFVNAVSSVALFAVPPREIPSNRYGEYTLEDLHTSYWKSHGGNGNTSYPLAQTETTVEFLKGLVEDLNYTSAVTGYASWNKLPFELLEKLTEYQKSIYFIHFYKSL